MAAMLPLAPAAADVSARYAARLAEAVRLRDGAEIVIRPLHPGDDAIERTFIGGLSKESRYNRLLSGRMLTPEEIRRLTRIDYDREMAFAAVANEGARAQLLGVARYVRDTVGTGAEFALVVADEWQRKGLGNLLLGTLLRHASAVGIGRLHGITLATNQGMQNLARKLGFVQKSDPQDATVRILETTLAPAFSPVAAHSGARRSSVAANDEMGAPGDAAPPASACRID